jgi:hypothetical protein
VPLEPLGALKLHGGPKKELGTHGKEGFHGLSPEYSEFIVGQIQKCEHLIVSDFRKALKLGKEGPDYGLSAAERIQ